jgi:MATE family multidrug resistance protein
VVGKMGQAAPIGAVGLGAIILAMLYWAFGFLRMGTGGLAAQARGAGDAAESTAVLLRALIVGAVAGVALVLSQGLLFRAALSLAPAGQEVETLARQYLGIRIWGAPATIALYAATGWLVAQERTRAILAMLLWQNGLNVGLDLWFVLGLGWGVPGVAAATLIAEWTGLALGLWFCRDAFGPALGAARARLADAAALRRMASVNGDIMLRSVLLQGAFTAFVFLGAGQGDVTLAANQVLMQFLEITAYALDGFAFSAETLVGQAVGAQSSNAVRRAAGLSSVWGAGGAALLGGLFFMVGPAIIDLMATDRAVRAAARAFLPWLAAAPLIGIAAWMFDGIFIGATRTAEMRDAMIAAVAIYAAALVILLPLLGNHGLWAALMVFNAVRGLTLGMLWPRIPRALDAARPA